MENLETDKNLETPPANPQKMPAIIIAFSLVAIAIVFTIILLVFFAKGKKANLVPSPTTISQPAETINPVKTDNQTLEADLVNLDSQLNNLDQTIEDVNGALNDKQGDLSER